MWINPIVLGVCGTLLAELVIVIACAIGVTISHNNKHNKLQQSNKEEDKSELH